MSSQFFNLFLPAFLKFVSIQFNDATGVALGLTNEQAINAVANNCATVLKHAVARKCRYLPLEVISKLDFKLRFPEISMDDSQSNNHNVPCVLSEDNPLKADLLDDDIDEDCDDEIEESQMNDDSFALYCTPRMVLGNSNDGTEIKPEKSEGSFNRADENDEKYSENGDNCDNDKEDDENDNENPSGYGLSFTGDDVGLIPNFIDSSEIFVKEIVGEENYFISSIDVKSQQKRNVEGMNTESREHKDGHGSILDISLNDDFDLGDSFISFSTSSSSRKRRIEEDIVEEEKILQPVLQSPIVVIKSSQHSIKKIKINKLNTMKIKTKKFMTKKIKR